MAQTEFLYNQASVISFLCEHKTIKQVCEFIENKYKNDKSIRMYVDDNKEVSGYVPYFEIWNKTSEQKGGSAITCNFKSVKKYYNKLIFKLFTNELEDGGNFGAIHCLEITTGKKNNEFNDTDTNSEFYNIIFKSDCVKHVLKIILQ